MQNAMFRDTEVSTEVTCRCPQCGAEEKVPISFPCWMLDIFRDKTPGLCSARSSRSASSSASLPVESHLM